MTKETTARYPVSLSLTLDEYEVLKTIKKDGIRIKQIFLAGLKVYSTDDSRSIPKA